VSDYEIKKKGRVPTCAEIKKHLEGDYSEFRVGKNYKGHTDGYMKHATYYRIRVEYRNERVDGEWTRDPLQWTQTAWWQECNKNNPDYFWTEPLSATLRDEKRNPGTLPKLIQFRYDERIEGEWVTHYGTIRTTDWTTFGGGYVTCKWAENRQLIRGDDTSLEQLIEEIGGSSIVHG